MVVTVPMIAAGNPDVQYRELALGDIHPKMLSSFVRRQEITQCLRKTGDGLVLVDNPHVIDWDANYKQEIINDEFPLMLTSGGALIGAYADGNLVGFAGIDGNLRGSQGQYVWLVKIHVSSDLRGHGIGSELLTRIADKARRLGGKFLYISSLSAKETQAFYRAMGCREADELDQELFAAEPYDIHLQYPLQEK